MDTDMTRSMFGFDPICVHPWNPCLKQAFHSISTCHPPTNLEELSFHDVIVVKSRHPLETWKKQMRRIQRERETAQQGAQMEQSETNNTEGSTFELSVLE